MSSAADRINVAAWKLVAVPEALEALNRGVPCPRRRLRAEALEAIGEVLVGPDYVLTEEDALRLCLWEPNGTQPVADAAHVSKVTGTDAESVASSLRFVPVEDFAAVRETSAEALLGKAMDNALPAGGSLLLYGDGGAGKTTLEIDLCIHMATGTRWLGLEVARPVRIGVIENEGPRGMFREKLDGKLAAWEGPKVDGRIVVLEEPWARFTFKEELHLDLLAEAITELEIELLVAGPVSRIGMEGGGTLDEVGAFMGRLELMRSKLSRPLALALVHHENNAGDVSGAWEGVPDTLVHVRARGNGATDIYWRKVRWGSTLHGQTWKLLWRDGETFEIDETPEITDEDVAESILAAVRETPGASWRVVEKDAHGSTARKRETRDRLLESGELVNVGTGGKFALFAAGDPALREMRLNGGTPEAHPVPAPRSPVESVNRALCLPLKEAQGARHTFGEPADEPPEEELAGTALNAVEGKNGDVPFPGDGDFLDFITAAHGAGHITTAEALERERDHQLALEGDE